LLGISQAESQEYSCAKPAFAHGSFVDILHHLGFERPTQAARKVPKDVGLISAKGACPICIYGPAGRWGSGIDRAKRLTEVMPDSKRPIDPQTPKPH